MHPRFHFTMFFRKVKNDLYAGEDICKRVLEGSQIEFTSHGRLVQIRLVLTDAHSDTPRATQKGNVLCEMVRVHFIVAQIVSVERSRGREQHSRKPVQPIPQILNDGVPVPPCRLLFSVSLVDIAMPGQIIESLPVEVLRVDEGVFRPWDGALVGPDIGPVGELEENFLW